MRVLEAFGEPVIRGGQEAFIFGVIEHMDMNGLIIDCLTPYSWEVDDYRSLVRQRGGETFELGLPFSPGSSRRNLVRPVRDFLSGHKYDVIHIHSGSISALTIMAAEADRAGVRKVIVHSHVTGETDSIKHKALRFLASLSMSRHVDIYCACSRAAADWKFETKYAERALIIKNGIDVDRFKFNARMRESMRKQLKLDGCFVVGHVGRFSSQKNHEFIVQIFRELSKRDSTARLLLVGDGEDRPAIEQMVRDCGLAEYVIFIGSKNNVQDYLQAMDVFVLPSRYEGLGIVAIEAQTAGLPVIASTRVPRDIELTDSVVFMSLEDGINQWINVIMRVSETVDRRDDSFRVRQAGYDVHTAAEHIRRIYIE